MDKVFKWFDKNLFHHVGRTIQNYAILSLVIDVIIVIVAMVGAIFSSDFFLDGLLNSLLFPVVGIGYALLFAYPIYAFGQLVEDIHQTRENTSNNAATNIDELPEL